MSDSLPRAPWR